MGLGFPYDVTVDKPLTSPTEWPRRDGLEVNHSSSMAQGPYMLIRQKAEMDMIERFYYLKFRMDEKGEEAEKLKLEFLTRRVLMHRRARFLDIYRGFVTGHLDLTGRHESRWNEFIDSFEEFMIDFARIAPFVEKAIGKPGSRVQYTVQQERQELYREWTQRWDVQDFEAKIVLGHYLAIYNLSLKKPQPKFQSLTLVDLPEDILVSIFDHCTVSQLVSLSQTCTALRWAQDHCHESCEFRFSTSDEKWALQGDRSHLAARVGPYASKCSMRSLKDIIHYISHREKCRRLKSLLVDWSWTIDPDAELHVVLDEVFQDGLFNLLYKHLRRLLDPSVLPQLTSLSLERVYLDATGFRGICSLPQLRSLSFSRCSLSGPEITEWFLESDEAPFTSPVVNLHLRFGPCDNPPANQWLLLPFFPNVRNLSFGGFRWQGAVHFPPAFLHSKFRCLDVLERLFVKEIAESSVPLLAEWLQSRRSAHSGNAGDKLTYFKLRNQIHIQDEPMQQLLVSLQSERLEALTIDGVHYRTAQPRMIEDIARLCPNIRALKLIVRANGLQQWARPVAWPKPSWAYAPTFEGFNRLQHFTWNYNTPVHESTPYPLEMFERAASGSDTDTSFEWECVDEDDLDFNDFERSVVPFAVYCPTLKTFALEYHEPLCEVIRERGGDTSGIDKIHVHCVDSKRREELLAENPDSSLEVEYGWPDL
ncbi:hypothetical protein CC1G_14116 [Coprinopsis cinerea okayama7|uniref:F-box domain-containing protein n=1 Tax=Coprinopsis cinerea (strain Okayama-7 / 130 / ATCC MYA-4618 / FGSC 9003) TaxID=240176 RepID=D6RLJ7_COPC7|nr:hypothetical protein CC1G_14116 [Coprinopsis cinerea okayama7\|eukprot:XP_002911583.1 hypothetical protein CC1G_14116 [Coprinopsis cinerea okayama7\